VYTIYIIEALYFVTKNICEYSKGKLSQVLLAKLLLLTKASFERRLCRRREGRRRCRNDFVAVKAAPDRTNCITTANSLVSML
jgi:hypothetical protein